VLQDATGQSSFVCHGATLRIFYANDYIALTHAWVNVDFMLDACLVGFLVSEPSS
jgi:hypothetical protein